MPPERGCNLGRVFTLEGNFRIGNDENALNCFAVQTAFYNAYAARRIGGCPATKNIFELIPRLTGMGQGGVRVFATVSHRSEQRQNGGLFMSTDICSRTPTPAATLIHHYVVPLPSREGLFLNVTHLQQFDSYQSEIRTNNTSTDKNLTYVKPSLEGRWHEPCASDG